MLVKASVAGLWTSIPLLTVPESGQTNGDIFFMDRVIHGDAPAALIGKSIPQATVACPTHSQYRIGSDRSS